MKKQKIIIFDGCDRTGKTTISKALSEKLNIPLFKRIDINKNYDYLIDIIYCGEFYTQLLEQTKYSIIFDRLYPSELVYSHVLNRLSSFEKIIDIDSRFAKMGAKIIITYKDKDKFIKDKIIPKELFLEINNKFIKFSKMSACNILLLNTSDENLEK